VRRSERQSKSADEPPTGRYLVICMNRSHYLNDWMFGFVDVIDSSGIAPLRPKDLETIDGCVHHLPSFVTS
jgi:hypothetical protein